MALLGTLQLELSAPTDRLSADLDRAQSIIDAQSVAMRKKMQGIAKDPLLMRVDDRELTALNKHLTSKQEHYKRVQDDFAKPLKVNVSYKEINEFDRRLKEVGRNRKISLGAGVLPSTLQGVKNSIGRLVLSPITIPIRLAQNAIKDMFRGAMTSIGSEIGTSVFAGSKQGLKDYYNYDVNVQKSVYSKIGEFKQANTDSKIGKIIKTTNERIYNSKRAIRYRVGDSVVAAVDVNDGKDVADVKIPGKIKVGFQEAFKDDKLKTETGRIARSVGNAAVDVGRVVFGSVDGLNPVTRAVDKKLRDESVRSTNERTIPLVTERVAEILADKKANKNTGKIVDDTTNEFFIAAGGYHGKNGLAGKRMSSDINKKTGDDVKAIFVQNTDTDIQRHVKVNANDPKKAPPLTDKFFGMIKQTMKANVRGYNKDEVEMVAQAIVAREKNPDVKIKFVGESGGSYNAQRAADTFGMMGYKNFEYMGIGAPELVGAMHPDNRYGQKIISKDEELGMISDQVFARVGATRKSDNPGQNAIGIHAHPYEGYTQNDPEKGYRKLAEVTNFIEGAPKPLDPHQLDTLKKEGQKLSSVDPNAMPKEERAVYSEEIYKSWQNVRRHALVATGKLKKDLDKISEQFEDAYLATRDEQPKFSKAFARKHGIDPALAKVPEPFAAKAEEITSKLEDKFFVEQDITVKVAAARKRYNELIAVHKELNAKRSPANVEKIADAKNELLDMSYELDRSLNNSLVFGTERAKVISITRQMRAKAHEFTNPELIGAPLRPDPHRDPSNGLENYWGEPSEERIGAKPFTVSNISEIPDPWGEPRMRRMDEVNGDINKYWGEELKTPKNLKKPFYRAPDTTGVTPDPWLDDVKTNPGNIADIIPAIRQFHDAVISFAAAVDRFAGSNQGGNGGGSSDSDTDEGGNVRGGGFGGGSGGGGAASQSKNREVLEVKPTPPAAPRTMLLLAPARTGQAVRAFVATPPPETPLTPKTFLVPNPRVQALLQPGLSQTASSAITKFIPPNATQQPISDYLATPSSLDNTKETVNYIYSSLERQKKAIEQAIAKGQIAIARNLNHKLDAEVKDAQSFIERFSDANASDIQSAQHLRSTVKGHINQKANFVAKADAAIDLVQNEAEPAEVRQAPNISRGLKGFITRGILARRAENARNPNPDGNLEGGYVTPFARVPMMDFMDTPVQSFKNTIEKVKNKIKNFLPKKLVEDNVVSSTQAEAGAIVRAETGTIIPYVSELRPTQKPKYKPEYQPVVPDIIDVDYQPVKGGAIVPFLAPTGTSNQPPKKGVDGAAREKGGAIVPQYLVDKKDEADAETSSKGFNFLSADVKKLIGAFGGYMVMSHIAPMLMSMGKAAFDTAGNFEKLRIQMAAASDSSQTGDIRYAQLTKAADKLGISRTTALTAGVGIAGTTFGTELEGASSEKMTNQILKIAQARGMDGPQSDSLVRVISQILSKNRTSAQEINELTQSAGITDARQIAARGLGYTPEQFANIQSSPQGIDSKRFATAFLSQGVQDSQSAQSLAEQSLGYKQTKLAAASENNRAQLAQTVMPIAKTGIDALTGSINLLTFAVEHSSLALLLFSVISAVKISSILSQMIFGLNLAQLAFKGLTLAVDGLIAIAPALKMLAVQFVLLNTAVGIWSQVYRAYANDSQDVVDATNKIADAIDNLNGKKINPVGKPQTARDVGGDDWWETGTLAVQRSLNSNINLGIDKDFNIVSTGITRVGKNIDSKELQEQKKTLAVSKLLTESSGGVNDDGEARVGAVPTVKKSIDSIKGIKDIDRQLEAINTERSGLFASGKEPNAQDIANITAKYNTKYQERDKIITDNTPIKSIGQDNINALKGAIAKYEDEYSKEKLSVEKYTAIVPPLKKELEGALIVQGELNDAIKSGFDNLLPWVTSLDKIAVKFTDIGVAANSAKERFGIVRNDAEISGKKTRGQVDYKSKQDEFQIIEAQISTRTKVMRELLSTINVKDPDNLKNTLNAYQLTDKSSPNQIAVAEKRTNSEVDKVTLANFKVYKEQELLNNTDVASLSNVRNDAFRKLYDENKQAQLYYVSLAQQLDPVANAFADASAKVVQSKDLFLAKLNNYGTGLFDVYTTAYLGLLDAGKDKLEQQAKLASEKKAAIDAYENRTLTAQGTEYSRFTPAAKLNGGMNTGGRSTTQRNQPVSTTPSSRNNIVPLDRNSGQGVAGQYRGSGNPQNHVDAAEIASRALRDQQLKAADRNFSVAEATSGSELRKIQAMQKLQEDRILIGQVSAKKDRDRKLQALDPNDEIGLQGKQNRARITQNNSLDDEKDVKINDVRQLTNSISNQKTTIRILQAKKNRTPEQEKALKDTISDLPRNESTVKAAQIDLAGFDKLAASKKASQLLEQKYQLGVSAENIKLDEQTVKAEALKTELNGLNQQLSIQPFNMEGKARARKIGDAIVEIEARSALTRADRKATEQGRTDEQFDDVADAKARTAAKKNYDRTIANNAKKDAQEALKDKEAYDAETRMFGISGAGIKVGGVSMAVRVSGQNDKVDAPFANTNTIQKEYDLKVEEFNKAKKERDDQYQKQIIHYKTSSFLKTVESQYADQNKLAEDGLKNDAVERDRQLNANAIGKRGYEFGQKSKFYDADTAAKTSDMEGVRNRGGDTHEMEFDLAVRSKQKETASRLIDLQAQRDAMTGDKAETIKAREEIDRLIVSTKELAVTDITNISDKFDRFNGVLGKVHATSLEVFTTWETTGKFDWRKILLSGLDEALKQINTKLMGDLFKPLYRQSEKTATPDTKSVVIQGAESAANMLGTGGGIKNGEPGLLNSDGSVNESDSSSTSTRSFTPSIAQPQVANPIGQQVPLGGFPDQKSIVTNGLVKLALPGGGFTTMSKQDAISNGFINLDGTSTTAPKPVPVVEPKTPYVEPVVDEPIDIPPSPIDEYDGFGIPQSGYDIRRLPLPDRRRASAGITGGGGSGSIGGSGGGGIAGSLISMALPSLLHIFGLKDGDVVKPDPMFRNMREGEDPIAKALRKEGNDAVIAALTPGERVLSLKQTSIYQAMFPQGIENHADGGVAGGITPVVLNLDPNKKNGSGDTNFHFDIDNSNRGADGQLQSRQLVEGLRSVVVQELIRQKRNGSGLIT